METISSGKAHARQVVLLLIFTLLLLLPCVRADAYILACHPDMTDLYDEPCGTVIARLFYNTPVTVLDKAAPAGWSHVTVGDDGALLSGWISDNDLDESDPGFEPDIGSGAIPCGGITRLSILAEPAEGSAVRAVWNQDSTQILKVTGITAGSRWLLVTVQENRKPVLWGFLPGDSVCSFSGAIVQSTKANTTVNLREAPSKKAPVIGTYYSGALAEPVFSFDDAQGWHRVCIGGVSGYMMAQFLETDAADGIPYRSPLLPLKGESAPLYAASAGTETVAGLPALTPAQVFCILGKVGSRWHVKVYTGQPDVWIFGFVDTDALAGKKPVCPGLDATLKRETPLFESGEETETKIRKGKKVRISYFCDKAPDQEGAIPQDYYREGAEWVWITVFLPGGYGFDEPYTGYIPVEALKFDEKLRLPANMGI